MSTFSSLLKKSFRSRRRAFFAQHPRPNSKYDQYDSIWPGALDSKSQPLDSKALSQQTARFRIPRLIGLLLPLSVALFLLAADDKPKTKPTGMVGLVKSTATDGKSFSLKARKGPYLVTWNKKTVWRAHELTTISEISQGTFLHILGNLQAPSQSSGGGTFPPQVVKIQAIVAGEGFEPPPLTEKDRRSKLEWLTGKLKEGQGELLLGDAVIGGGRMREVLVEKQLDGTALGSLAPKAKDQIFVAGHLDDSDRKAKKIAATEIIRVNLKFKGYETTHALKTRKPDPKSKKKSDDFGF